MYAYKPQWDNKPLFNLIIRRWRGAVVGIRTNEAHSNWLSFGETNNSNGYVRAYQNPVHSSNSFHSMKMQIYEKIKIA